jgi:hypothetical protein
MQRSFADGLAYISSYKKDPDHVTAVALGRTPQKIVVWLAANAEVEDSVVGFLEDVLKEVQWVAETGQSHITAATSQRLAAKVIAFCAPRSCVYYDIIRKHYVSPCLDVICGEQENLGQ